MKIRKGTFETNSSSTHAIFLDEDSGIYDTILPNKSGEIRISGGEYGWSFERFTLPKEKASYLLASLEYGYCAENKEEKLERLTSVIAEHTGVSRDKIHLTISGYVDHQSWDIPKDIWGSDYKIKQFIFGKWSVLFTGNDNDSADPDFFYNKDTCQHKLRVYRDKARTSLYKEYWYPYAYINSSAIIELLDMYDVVYSYMCKVNEAEQSISDNDTKFYFEVIPKN